MDDFDDDFLGNLSQQELRDKQVSLVRTHTHTHPPPPPPPPPPCTDRYALIDKNDTHRRHRALIDKNYAIP